MKIKRDFVTNSSSTSFVIIVNDNFLKDDFYKAIGISKESEILPLFNYLYESFINNMEDSVSNSSIFSEFSQETQDRIEQALKEDKKVFAGKLSSDNNPFESFFCCEYFVIDNENIFIDASINMW